MGLLGMRLFLIRHGATEWSATGQHTGRTDLPLTSEGLAQLGPLAHELRAMVANEFDSLVAYSSPLARALVTARSVMGDTHDLRIDANLVEFNYGDYEGLTSEQIREVHPGWDLWRDGCPNGENVEDAGRRADAFLALLENGPEVVVTFAHAHISRIIAARAVGLAPRDGEIFNLDTATVSVIGDVRGKRVVQHWNVEPRSN